MLRGGMASSSPGFLTLQARRELIDPHTIPCLCEPVMLKLTKATAVLLEDGIK